MSGFAATSTSTAPTAEATATVAPSAIPRALEVVGVHEELVARPAAGGTGKALHQARLDGIGPYTNHNDGKRFGRVLGRPDERVSSRYHDDINPETHKLGSKFRSSIVFPVRISVLDGDVLSF